MPPISSQGYREMAAVMDEMSLKDVERPTSDMLERASALVTPLVTNR